MAVNNEIYKSTIRIECNVPGGVSVGTGFWFAFQQDEGVVIPLIVTNKHVVNEATQVKLRLNVKSNKNPGLKFYNVEINQGKGAFIDHPDPNIDICILPMGAFLTQLTDEGIEVQAFSFTDKEMLSDKFITPIEDVYMTGYPNGLWDSVNNRPITRKGVTASSPKEDWQGNPEFLIDMACFGGSSGSPVYIMNQGAYASEHGTSFGERFILLGILYAGPTVNVDGSIEIVNVPTATTAVVRSTIGLNLGLVIKAEKLNDFKPLMGI
ncbi:S1 family peptidase [Ewingella sp. AOP9-I1-14]